MQKLLMTVPVATRPTSALGTRRAAVAVTVMFAVNGMLLGGFGGSLPSLRERLDLSAAQIAIMLFAGGLAAITSMQIGGRLADALGARRIALSGLPVLIAAAVVLAFAPTYGVAIAGAMLIGFGNGAMDVAMNALGVQVEQARRKPIMSFFHAFFSVGSFIGAGTVLLIATLAGISGAGIVLPLMITLAVVAAAVLVVLLRITPEAEIVSHSVRRRPDEDPADGLAARGHGPRVRAVRGHGGGLVGLARDRRRAGRLDRGLPRPDRGQWLHGVDPADR